MMTTIIAIVGALGTLGTGFGAIVIAKMNNNNDRQKYYENKISEILEIQSKEISSLKEEVAKLVKENRWLRHQLEKLGWGDDEENVK